MKLFARGDGVAAAKIAGEAFGASVSEVATVVSSDPGINEAVVRAFPLQATE